MNIRNVILSLVALLGGAPVELAGGQPLHRVACIGNSITFGAGIADPGRFSYPAQLQLLLGPQWQVRNFGSSGRTLLQKGDFPYRKEPEFRAAKEFLPDVVVIKLGTNDTKPQNWKFRAEFLADYESLVGEFQRLPSRPKVYLCTPVPAFPGDWGISDSIIVHDLIPMLRSLSSRMNLPLIDLYAPLKPHAEFFPDKVHPDGDGARLIARTVYDALAADFRFVKAPDPVEPLPSSRQQAWQDVEYAAFLHFGLNTYTDREWGYGDEEPKLFNPAMFDATSLVRTLRDAGMREVILTCKHHDGFCLWPSKTTTHTVARSAWKNGDGDIVGELAAACRAEGMKFGVYLSPWDRNAASYGSPAYVNFYREQLKELLTSYGPIAEVWFDGANGGDGCYGGARETRTIDRRVYYGWEATWNLVRSLQPDAVMFSDVGPDLRWVGNENGFAGETCWSPYTPVGEKGDAPAPGYVRSEEGTTGHRNGARWIPPECDVSIRPGWFYHAAEDSLVKSPQQLFDLYCKSVGRNGSLLLNVPPDRNGRLHPADVTALQGLKHLIDRAFEHDRALEATATASNTRGGDPTFGAGNVADGSPATYWATDDSVSAASVTLRWKTPVTASLLLLEEFLPLGQRVERFVVEARTGKEWHTLGEGTTIGHKRILRFPRATMDELRVRITAAKASPTLCHVGVYIDPVME